MKILNQPSVENNYGMEAFHYKSLTVAEVIEILKTFPQDAKCFTFDGDYGWMPVNPEYKENKDSMYDEKDDTKFIAVTF